MEAGRVYGFGDAMRALGLSSNMVDAYLKAYEAEMGPMPRVGNRGNAPRLIPEAALATIKRARGLVAAKPGSVSVQDAMRQALGRQVEVEPPGESLAIAEPAGEAPEAIGALLAAVRAMRAENSELRAYVAQALELQSQRLAEELRALPDPDPSSVVAPLLERLARLERSKLELVHAAAERGMLQAQNEQIRDQADAERARLDHARQLLEQAEHQARVRAAEREMVEAENMRLRDELEVARRPRSLWQRLRGR